ncbi:hypothetical protein JTE90_027288 [Oedothorax gibbosus]|uniref:Uncharacterized protein n=1 Tax=Oedothorax gibbosus TaxID=931172 RepID=A0AAV6VXS2_9ARAC|nr:hypothetical protein JTE90_027288 [Oedothorax gibbosus]
MKIKKIHKEIEQTRLVPGLVELRAEEASGHNVSMYFLDYKQPFDLLSVNFLKHLTLLTLRPLANKTVRSGQKRLPINRGITCNHF